MDWNNINRDRDTSGLGPIEYDQTKVPALIRKHADNVRTKTYGQEVREAQARNAEYAGLIASEANIKANSADILSKDTQNRFNDQIAGTTNNDEVIDARRPFGAETAFTTVGERLDFKDLQMRDLGVNIRDFGGGTDVADNHDAIMQAIDYAFNNNYSYVLLPAGEVKTSPISLEGYYHITLVGTASGYYSGQSLQTGTTLKIISAGDVAVKLTGSTLADGTTEWRAVSNCIRGVKIDCSYQTQVGVNAAYNNNLFDVYVIKSAGDGIVTEAMTYPVKLSNVFAAYNQGNGFRSRAPYSTVYNLENCEFSRNDGYGMVVEGGATVSAINTTIQSNKVGGLKINFPDVSNFVNPTWLHSLLFTNLYTENNGLLEATDPKYEGNFAVVISSESDVASNIPRNIKFVNSAINQSSNGKTLKITHANTVYIDASFGSQAVFEIDTDKEKVKGIAFSRKADEYMAGIAPTQVNTFKTFEPKYAMGVQTNGGFYGSRGRNSVLYFGYKDLGNFGSQYGITLPNLPAEDGRSNTIYYPMVSNGSILRVSAVKLGNVGNPTGSLEIQIYIDDVLAKTVDGTEAVLPWAFATSGRSINKNYAPSELSFRSGSILKVRLVSKGHQNGTSEYNAYSIGLLIEC